IIETKTFYDFLTGKAYTALSRRLQKNFRNAGIEITSEQWSILYALWEEEGLTQQELAQRTFREKTTITRLIDNMERNGLVIRVTDKSDRRTNLIYLTKAGRQLKEACMKQADQTLREALSGVDAGDIGVAKDTLKKVYENLK
ncbi:MarR family transcriptional regulator, partial [Parapedobacter defluvii]|uniref:MarR family winged helix-turn-helix transcriptional regulator n=1 Tax=Parapedobacter defluvii TaxID=2045106 RepID=UPI00334251EC